MHYSEIWIVMFFNFLRQVSQPSKSSFCHAIAFNLAKKKKGNQTNLFNTHDHNLQELLSYKFLLDDRQYSRPVNFLFL